jgi:hypothetical protein
MVLPMRCDAACLKAIFPLRLQTEELKLYESDVLLCLQCVKHRGENPKTITPIGAALTRGLAEATIRVTSASMEFDAVSSYIPNSFPTPEKTQRIKDAAHFLVSAREELTEAQNRLDDYLNHGVIPIDLKRSD